MNPLLHLLPAVYAALTEPAPPEVGGAPVGVFQHLPAGFSAPLYVLLGQPTADKLRGAQGCKAWNCTVLLDCVTLHTPGQVSSVPADILANDISTRLDGQQLSIGGGFSVGLANVEQILGLDDAFDGKQVDVHRYARCRFQVTLNS